MELLQAVSKSLIEYVNEIKDDINGDMILQFLINVLPDKENGTKIRAGQFVSQTESKD